MKKKILLIDDESNFGGMVKINLEQTGAYEVDTALNAEEGFERIESNQYDVIFLDVLMPKIEGHVALEKIKTMCDTPVVIMSAYVPSQRKSAIVAMGAYTCLEKPISLDRIIATIDEIIK